MTRQIDEFGMNNRYTRMFLSHFLCTLRVSLLILARISNSSFSARTLKCRCLSLILLLIEKSLWSKRSYVFIVPSPLIKLPSYSVFIGF